jgi:hypothetical protein
MLRRSVLAAATAWALATPASAFAQGGPGYLFRPPKVALGVRVGYSWPQAGGDLFGFTKDQFIPLGADTLSTLDFGDVYVAGELAIRPWEQWDVVLGFGWTQSEQRTEYRRWEEDVGTSRLPIEQMTTLEIITGTLGAEYYFLGRGRRVGRLAWVPRRLMPFLGGGIGFSSYQFEQVGDFVDESTSSIYGDYLKTNGAGFLWYANAGLDVSLGTHVILSGEARYSWSNAGVKGSYVGFDSADLDGFQLMGGLGFQF